MSDDKKCNGWNNYATWRVSMELCDDIIQELILDGEKFASIGDLARRLEDTVDECLTDYGQITDGIALNYARSFVNDVDWYEIAEHAADDLVRGEDEDEEAEAAPGPCPSCDGSGEGVFTVPGEPERGSEVGVCAWCGGTGHAEPYPD